MPRALGITGLEVLETGREASILRERAHSEGQWHRVIWKRDDWHLFLRTKVVFLQ